MSNTLTQSLPGPDSITRTQLDNGITVLVYENHAAQSVVFAGSLRAGSRYDPAAKTGLATFTAEALLRGTQNRDFDIIHDALESIGADLDFDTNRFETRFSGKSLAEDLPTMLDLLADALRRPIFPDVQIERLRGEIVNVLQIRSYDTGYRANRAFLETLYPDQHPYYHPTMGTLDTIANITADDLRGFHQQHYAPDDMTLVVVGAVGTRQTIDAVQRHFADWERLNPPTDPPLPEVTRPTQTQRTFVPVPGKTQVDIVMGALGPARSTDDYYAATIANSVLGMFGMMGRIGYTVREQLGLAYYAYSQIEPGHVPSPWRVSAGVNPANTDLAIERITDELRRLTTEPVSAEDLADNQAYYTGRLPLQLESNDGIASTLLSMELYDLGLDYLLTYRDRIYALTEADLLAAAQHYLNPDALIIAVAGSADAAETV